MGLEVSVFLGPCEMSSNLAFHHANGLEPLKPGDRINLALKVGLLKYFVIATEN